MTKEKKNVHNWKNHLTLTIKGMQHQIWATSCSPKINLKLSFSKQVVFCSYQRAITTTKTFGLNTTASSEKLVCPFLCGFWQKWRTVWTIFWYKNNSNYLEVKPEVFERDANRNFRLVLNTTMEESGCHQFLLMQRPKFCPSYRMQQSLRIWRNISAFFTKRITLSTDKTERFMQPSCETMWTSHRVFMLNSDFLREKWRRELKKSSIGLIKLLDIYEFFYFALWILYTTWFLFVINLFVRSSTK